MERLKVGTKVTLVKDTCAYRYSDYKEQMGEIIEDDGSPDAMAPYLVKWADDNSYWYTSEQLNTDKTSGIKMGSLVKILRKEQDMTGCTWVHPMDQTVGTYGVVCNDNSETPNIRVYQKISKEWNTWYYGAEVLKKIADPLPKEKAFIGKRVMLWETENDKSSTFGTITNITAAGNESGYNVTLKFDDGVVIETSGECCFEVPEPSQEDMKQELIKSLRKSLNAADQMYECEETTMIKSGLNLFIHMLKK